MTLNQFGCWRRLVSIVFVIALLPGLAAAANAPVPLDPAVRTGQLPNGFTYYIRKNVKPEKRVELRLAVNSGSVQEDDDQLGLAHFVEHMCFNGTEHFPKNELIHYLQSVGANFGPEINGYTSFDETVYMLTIPSDKADVLDKGLQIMADWAHGVTFDDTEIDKERGVIVEEWRLGRGPDQRMRDKFLPVLFKDSKYAVRLPIGTKDSIEKSSHEVLKRFYRDWYRPDNMAFVVVGDIDPDQILAAIQAKFGGMPAAAQPRPREAVAVPDHEGTLYSIVSDKENPFNIVRLAFKTAPRTYTTTDDYRRRFAERLFVRMLNQRLEEIAQQPNPPFVQAGANYGRIWVRTKDAFQLTVVVPDNGFPRGLAAALTETERVQRFGFTAPELDRAKRNTMKGLEQAYNEREKTQSSHLVSRYVDHFLEQEPAAGIEYDYAFAQQHLAGVSLEEINRFAGEWIRPQNRVVVLQSVEKEGVKIPTEADLQAVAQQVAASKIEPYQERQLAAALMARPPRPGRIVSEKQIPEVGVTELALANGVRVVLKPTTFQNDEILVTAYRPGGQSVFGDEYHLSAQVANPYAGEAGVAEFSRIDLQKMLAGKKVAARVRIGTYFDGIGGNCAVADRETLFQLLHLGFTAPRRDEGALQSLVTRQRAILKNVLTNPTYSFFNDVQKARYNNHPRDPEVLPTDEQWETVTLDRVMEVRRSRFENADGYTFIFVGSFTVDAIKPLVETYLASLPGKPGPHAWRDLGLRSIKGPVDQSFHRGADPKSFVAISLEGPAAYSRDESHRLWSLANILERIYTDKLREEMSGVYGFGVSASVEQVPYGHFVFRLMIPCGPENVQKLTEAAYAEIKRIQTDGPTAEELQKEIESQRRAAEKDAKENKAWLSNLEKVYRDGESFGRLANPEELIALVTAPELQRVARQYLHPEETLRYTLYPEQK